MPEIKETLVSKSELAANIAATLRIANPEPSNGTKDKSYWIQGIVKNCTQFPLQVRPPPYFNTGKYETWPEEVAAWSVGQFTAVNGNNTGGGATGGNAWGLHLEQGLDVELAFGFTCPVVGSYKSAVVESITPQDGYNQATSGGNKIVSKNEYYGADADGKNMTIVFEVQCSGGQQPVYTITQVAY